MDLRILWSKFRSPCLFRCDLYACMKFPVNSIKCYGDTVDEHFDRTAADMAVVTAAKLQDPHPPSVGETVWTETDILHRRAFYYYI